jgi:hypothetical protein
MVRGGVINDAMAQQRPILHQAEHGVPLSMRGSLVSWTGALASLG